MAEKSRLSQSTMHINIPPPIGPAETKRAGRIVVTRTRPRHTSKPKPDSEHKKPDPDTARYSALLQGIYDAVLITDQSGAILDMNGRAMESLDYEREELLGLNIRDIMSGPADSLIALILRNLKEERSTVIDGYCIRGDGLTFPAEIAVNRIFISSAGELCFLVRDTTRRKEIEQDLRRANKMKSLHILAGGLAHDFNNLLTSVIGNTELALGSISEKSRAREDLQVALDDAKKLAELSHRMTAFSGKGLLRTERVDLNSVVAHVLSDMSSEIPPHIEIRMRLSPEPPVIGGEADILAVMLTNLMMNAVDAIGPRQGTISLQTSIEEVTADFIQARSLQADLRPGPHVCLRIQDTGYGMDEVIMERVFDPFFSTKGAGRGLGLSEVQGTVLAHGGAVLPESTMGKGSTFTVFLPVYQVQTLRANPKPETTTLGIAGAKILVVDDESSIRRYSARILKRHGAIPFLAEDGQDAIDQFRAHADEIDLVLLDMFMPRMNGDKVLQAIRKIRPDVKVLIMSGYTESMYLDRFNDEPPTGSLYKPFATVDFLNILKTTLAGQTTSTP